MTQQETSKRSGRGGSQENKKVYDRIKELTKKDNIEEGFKVIEDNLKIMGGKLATMSVITIVFDAQGLVDVISTTNGLKTLNMLRAFEVALDDLRRQVIEPRKMELIANQVEKQKKMTEKKEETP